MRAVPFYFDFVSPYSWLALERAPLFAREHGIRFDPRPVVYAKLLEAHGLLGPAETDAKRRYTYFDVARCARRAGLRLEGPPAHPFRSLEALRVAVLYRNTPHAMDLAVALAHACWAEGRDLCDAAVLERTVDAVGLDAARLSDRAADPAVKRELQRLTEEALALGLFGVPSFVVDGDVFWGHDRIDQLAERLAGGRSLSSEEADRLLARPRAVVRRGTGSAPVTDDDEHARHLFETWLDAYGRAWEWKNADAFVALFTPAADYHWTPFGPPKQGREGIRTAFDAAVTTQRDIRFSHDVLAVDQRRGIAHWTCRLVRIATAREFTIDGILTAEFDPAGLCHRFREWWHSDEA